MAGHDPRDSTSLDRPREDYTRLLRAAAGAKPLAGLRIGLPREYFGEGIDADVAAAVDAALAELRKLGAHDRRRDACPTSICRCRCTT